MQLGVARFLAAGLGIHSLFRRILNDIHGWSRLCLFTGMLMGELEVEEVFVSCSAMAMVSIPRRTAVWQILFDWRSPFIRSAPQTFGSSLLRDVLLGEIEFEDR